MKTSKKGFTLTEIIIVVAIIVIISGAAIAGIAVTVKNAGERGEQIAELHGDNWESGAKQNIKDNVPTLGADTVYEESLDTPTPAPESDGTEGGGSGDEDDGSSTGGGSTDGGSTSGGSTDGGSTSGGSTDSNTTTGGGTSSDTTTGGDTISGGSSGSSSSGSSVTVSFPKTVTTGNGNGSGVQKVENNSSGSVTVTLQYLDWNVGTVNISKNSNGKYVLQTSESNKYFIAAPLDNNYGLDYSGGFELNDTQIDQLNKTFGLTLD